MRKHVKGPVWSVGRNDWELRQIHSDSFATPCGTSFNAYIVEDEKAALIDTVPSWCAADFVAGLEREGWLARLDLIVINHCEPDHSAALPLIMERRPELPIYVSPAGIRSLAGNYPQSSGWEVRAVKTGDRLSLGARELTFFEAPMLHWPDTMFSHLSGENILFSTDAFGQHLASEHVFADQVDVEAVFDHALKYYANLLTPFAAMVRKSVIALKATGLPIEVICTSHGLCWRGRTERIMDKYLEWAECVPEDRVIVVYDSMWGATKEMGELIAEGIQQADAEVTVSLLKSTKYARSDVMTELFRSKAIVLGSPTVNSGVLPSVSGLMDEIRGLRFKGKRFAAFGSYGWSGEALGHLNRGLEEAGLTKMHDGLRMLWRADESHREKCLAMGREIAEQLRG